MLFVSPLRWPACYSDFGLFMNVPWTILALLAAAPAYAVQGDELLSLVNAYRAAPGKCNGRQAPQVPPLVVHRALTHVQIGTGTFLELALERAGYPAELAELINVSGPTHAKTVMATMQDRYCSTLLNPEFRAMGARHNAGQWQIVFAQPVRPSVAKVLPERGDAGQAILDAVNRARAEGRTCGDRAFAAVPPLTWNDTLAEAALAHSRDMAAQRYFSHEGKDGRVVADRATYAGYHWRKIGENIAAGQESPEEVVAGWLASPGHCANIMHPEFTEMGMAYAINSERKMPRAYWTQVFGTPR
jgi:uncharacterized protein YkwD